MSRSPLFNSLLRICRKAFEPESSPPQVATSGQPWSRRDFLRVSSAAATTLAIEGLFATPLAFAASPARVAIIGAGIAGLSCAYKLRQMGIRARVFEASTRVGGRMFSARNAFPNNQVAELGGEFIDTGHRSIRTMCRALGIAVDDLRSGETFVDERFFVNGRYLTEEEILAAFRPLAAEMRQAVRASDRSPAAFAALDAMSIPEWIDSTGAAGKDLKDLLVAAYTEEYGLEADQQSVFNLLYLIDYERLKRFRIFGDSDERFHIRGGNDLLTTKLASKLGNQIETSSLFTSLRKASGGGFRVGFSRESGFQEQRFDMVVLALPFTLLREANLDVDLPVWKRRIIDEVGYGTNAKLMSGYTSRYWRSQNSTGSVIGNNGIQTCWDSSRKQRGDSGILTIFQGGNAGVQMGTGTAEEQMSQYLPLADQLFPGVTSAYIPNSAVRMWWPGHPFTKGSYTCYRPGQAAFSGLEGKRVGNLFFCGEHCSVNFQGYMEGGCESGLKTATHVIKRLGVLRRFRGGA